MSGDEIRAELEAAHREYRAALLEEDFEAVARAAIIGDDLSGRKAKKRLKKGHRKLVESAHDISGVEFLAVGELPDGVRAYVYLYEEPGFPKMRALVSRYFRQREGSWKVLTDAGNLQFFNLREGEEPSVTGLKELRERPEFWLPQGASAPDGFVPEVSGLGFTYGQEPEPTGFLPEEMEEAYRAYRRALQKHDVEACLGLAFFAEEASREEAEELFRERCDGILEGTPDLSETEHLLFRELPGALAAYGYVHDYPYAAGLKEIVVRYFRREENAWKVRAECGWTHQFRPDPGEDVVERARREMASDPGSWIPPGLGLPPGCLDEGWTPPEPEEAVEPAPTPPAHWERVMGPWDARLVAWLHCFAYDCELAITINGVRLGYGGGSSYNLLLSGYKWGEDPKEPNVLTVGTNRIEIATRWTGDPGPPATVQIRLSNDRDDPLCFQLQTMRAPEATYEAEFDVPVSPTSEIPEGSIETVDIRDGL